MRVLINASNLHVGGGVQVACSFITELAKLFESNNDKDISIVCSSAVRSNLDDMFDESRFAEFSILDVYGIKKLSDNEKKIFNGYDVCFTVFGPFYFNINVKKHICGFAQPWIAYPDNDVYPKLSFLNRYKTKLKFIIQSFIFKRYDMLVVEQSHVKRALLKYGYKSEKVEVVSNCYSSVFDDESKWEAINFERDSDQCTITLGFIGRPYTHKNIEILKDVDLILKEKHNLNCDFIFTFSDKKLHHRKLQK